MGSPGQLHDDPSERLRDPESERLHTRAQAFVRAFTERRTSPEPYDALAVDLARFQASRVPGLARLGRARGVDLARVTRADELPAVPTDAFRHMHLASFSPQAATITFRTSGTSSGARGAHAMRHTRTYDAGAVAFGRHALFAGLGAPPHAIVLAPPPALAPDSSLGHMLARFVAELCAPLAGAEAYFLGAPRDGAAVEVAVDALEARVASLAARGEPAVVLGTSFAFVHLLDAIGDRALHLPPGSRLMQTGGFKGRSREIPAAELRAALARAFGLPERAVVCEYGMTELSSQFYEGTLLAAGTPHGVYIEPPWARVVPVDPESLCPVPDGEIGLARIEDLLNVDSAFAVQTQDQVRRVEGGFALLGRSPLAPPRGCSIAIDELLGGARGASEP
ncbi:MAG: acyl-protein synthetase [Myxococcales bacterium]|nr:acyl-protein synthetase [Myxococcales bacterium]MBL0193036.1 acyl-protein synthetase [Myxococcales bacterium]